MQAHVKHTRKPADNQRHFWDTAEYQTNLYEIRTQKLLKPESKAPTPKQSHTGP